MKGILRTDSIVRGTPVTLLVIVAVIQMMTALCGAVVPWKGGGFGMFSTFDRLEVRVLRGRARPVDSSDWMPLDLRPRPVDGLPARTIRTAVSAPTERRLREVALIVLDAAWRVEQDPEGQYLVVTAPYGNSGGVGVEAVEIWVESARFETLPNRMIRTVVSARVRCGATC